MAPVSTRGVADEVSYVPETAIPEPAPQGTAPDNLVQSTQPIIDASDQSPHSPLAPAPTRGSPAALSRQHDQEQPQPQDTPMEQEQSQKRPEQGAFALSASKELNHLDQSQNHAQPHTEQQEQPAQRHQQQQSKRRLFALSIITVVANAGRTTIAPILPLEIVKRSIPEQWLSLIFFAESIGSAVAAPIMAHYFESIGTAKVVAYSMAGMSVMFWFTGMAFDIASMMSPAGDGGTESTVAIVALLAAVQFFLGAFHSIVATGYYSMGTLMFVEQETAMSGE